MIAEIVSHCIFYHIETVKYLPVWTNNIAFCLIPQSSLLLNWREEHFGHIGVNETVSDVGVTFHNITWHSTSRQGVVQHDPSVNLLCSFAPSDDDTLLYHIDWYVDNDTVIQGQTVDKDSLQDAILSAEDMLKAGKKINCWVYQKCKVVHLLQYQSKSSYSQTLIKLMFLCTDTLRCWN